MQIFKKSKTTTKAYTLVEIIVTLVVLSAGILGILSAFSFGSRNTVISDNKILATNKGRELLEDLRAKIDSRTWDSSWDLQCDTASHPWPGGETFQGNPIVYNCANDASGARRVTITVPWNN